MKTIRSNVFETNSSSCHSLTMCDGDIYNKIGDGEWFISISSEDVADKAKIKENLSNLNLTDEEFEKTYSAFLQYFNYVTLDDDIYASSYNKTPDYILKNYEGIEKESFSEYFELSEGLKEIFSFFTDYTNLDGYFSHFEDYETFEESFTSKNGDCVVAFGYYGYDS